MKKTLLLTASFLALSSAAAFAEGPYVAADLGLAIVHDSDVKPSGAATINTEYDTGFAFDLKGGYAYKRNLRAEVEFGYRSADVDKFGGVSASDSELRVLSYMVNGYYDATQLKLPVLPYVGLGLGLLNGKLKANGTSDSDNTFGYQLMFGASYPINKQISVDAGYKLQGAFADFEKNNTKISYISSNLLVGARFNF